METQGFREMDALLNKLPVEIAKKVIEQATRAAAKIVLEAAQRKVPIRTGQLKDSLAIKKDTKAFKRAGLVVYKVGANLSARRGKIAPHAHLVEFGTKGGVVKSGRFAGAKIPPMAARPFLRPALEESRAEILKVIAQMLFKGIQREAAKLAGRRKTRRLR